MRKVKNAVTALMAALFMCSTAVPLCPAAAYDACDVNHDGSVDIVDVIAINQHLSCERAYKNYNQLDANRSHTIDSTDANCVMAKVTKNSYSACYIRRDSNGNPQPVNMPAISSTITLDSVASDSLWQWYVGYTCVSQTLIPRYKLKPNSVTLTSTPGAQTYKLIGGDDNRVRAYGEENTGIVSVNGATGFIVGDHQIATAAHVIYMNNHFTEPTEIITYNRNGTPTNTKLTPVELHVPEMFTQVYTNNGCMYDYGLVTVKEDLSGYMHFDIGNAYNMTNSEAGAIPIYVTGNPQYFNGNPEDKNVNHLLYTHNSSIYGSDNRLEFHYTVDTSSGQSGAPVYTITRETYNNETYFTYTALSVLSGGNSVSSQGPLMTKYQQMFYNNNPNAHYQ